ncbi:MAG: type 4a pilus biogenesis protein PilO [Syntrophobacterales bacterium]|jgi:type IV pilus assembly protein PilO|nr:type 4a pilus biogenesis protein PilO [Syntrophobacterales bacterium]
MAISADDLKRLSPKAKAGLIIGLFCLIGYFYYMLYLQDAWAQKERSESQLAQLKEEVKKKEKIAADREKYIVDLEALQADFQAALQKLPDKKEIPLLLEAISEKGRAAGVDFLLFEPVPVIPQVKKDEKKTDGSPAESEEFYQDIPVRVRIVGTYADTLDFLGEVSRLPRIINVEDLVVGGQKDSRAGSKANRPDMLITSCVLKTYMFLEQQ